MEGLSILSNTYVFITKMDSSTDSENRYVMCKCGHRRACHGVHGTGYGTHPFDPGYLIDREMGIAYDLVQDQVHSFRNGRVGRLLSTTGEIEGNRNRNGGHGHGHDHGDVGLGIIDEPGRGHSHRDGHGRRRRRRSEERTSRGHHHHSHHSHHDPGEISIVIHDAPPHNQHIPYHHHPHHPHPHHHHHHHRPTIAADQPILDENIYPLCHDHMRRHFGDDFAQHSAPAYNAAYMAALGRVRLRREMGLPLGEGGGESSGVLVHNVEEEEEEEEEE
ncbi:uncharacterized protein GGS25DRAFT_531496 [Hypoxylon fragiforme]|uniref:uncharacterized protein n=1 Tax=Hypoxylon fragiforme TaxID=63214 RepID=UPI0020C6E8F7|nr:uncharacterized protein GGS25DRAFT_531496 [Hypoxylon fragiforme]KAI2608284.1 hypothetical protein GGS25DRAFT_531496 [Hypoxylon fragiforme]